MPNTDTTPLNQTVSEEMDMFVSIGKIPANAQVTVADTGWTEEEIERMRARGYDGIDMISAWYRACFQALPRFCSIVQPQPLRYAYPMFEQEKIAVSRLRQAYNLSATEADNLVLSLWPSKAFPLELWQEAHETYWRSFAERNASLYGLEIPSLPEVGDAQTFNSYLLSCDVMLFFQKLSRCIHVHALELGLRHILENSHDEPDAVFPEERQTLLDALSKSLGYQPVEYDQSMRKEDDGFQEDSPAFIPVSYYHIISRIFLNTILVDRTAAIRLLHEYPWQEVKGLTRAVVEAALKPDSSSSSLPPVESNPSAETVTEVLAEDGKLVFRVPAALWQGKPDPAVRDAMKASYPRAVIAYVLLHWCGPGSPGPDHKTPQGRKTHVGRLLAEKEYRDEKSYRNQVDTLLKEADAYTILQA